MSEEPEAKRARFASKNGGETNPSQKEDSGETNVLSQAQPDVIVVPSQKEDSFVTGRRCSNCKNEGHNKTTCPLLHPVDSAKSSAKSKPKKNVFGRSSKWKFPKQLQ